MAKLIINSSIIVLILIGLANNVFAQNPVTKISNDTEPIAIKEWLIAGTFPSADVELSKIFEAKRHGYSTDFLKSIGGEAHAVIEAGTFVKSEQGKSIEFKLFSWEDDYLDLSIPYGQQSNVCAYLYTEIVSETKQSVALHLGTNDAGKLWVAGKLLAQHNGERAASRSQNTALVNLIPGKRCSILIKIDQGGGGWGAFLEVYGLTAHQQFMKKRLPERLEIRAIENYLFAGDTLHASIEEFSINWFELDVPTKWEIKNGDNLITINGKDGKVNYKIPNGLEGESILLASKQVGNKVITGRLPFMIKQKTEKVFPINGKILNIGNRRELFVDNFLIHKMINTQLILQKPKDEGIVFRFVKPWEGQHSAYFTIINTDNKYKMYYRGSSFSGGDSDVEYTCYAESKDGIHWEKPELEIYEIMGTRKNNVILYNNAPLTHNFSPFLDSNPDVLPEEKYKAFGGHESSGLYGFTSKDGIHWKKIGNAPLFTKGFFDSQNVAFWSQSEKQYVLYFRTWTGPDFTGIRTIGRTTSKDFLHWSEPVRMDFGYTPLEHLYTNQTSPYFRASHIYVAIAARFMPGRQVISEDEAKKLKVAPGYLKDCSDVVFMTSRGENKYDRTFMGSFIKPGIGLQNWVSRTNYPALNVVETSPTEMSIYVNQDYSQPTAHLRRYSLRIDGFTSLNAPYIGGEMITKPFYFSGNTLSLNFSTSAAGFIKVEVLDVNGKIIEGFELENSKEMIGNEIRKIVTWKGKSDLQKLSNRAIMLRFVMKDADLYSIRFN